MVDLTIKAFDLADKYRNPAMVLGDGLLGQMMEPVEFKERKLEAPAKKEWALGSCKDRDARRVVALNLDPSELEKLVNKIGKKFEKMQDEVDYELVNMENPDIIIVAYGTIARVAKTTIQYAKKEGINIGLIRPITLYPFPYKIISQYAEKVKHILVTEMSLGQMVEDVKLAVEGKAKISFYGRTGGVVISPKELLEEVKKIIKK